MKKLIYLAKRYDLVVGDKFEMFYRGVIKSMNPYKYYIYINCKKGRNYPRYYTFTPTLADVGDHELTLSLYDDYHDLIETATTTLHVVNPAAPARKQSILCFGDSLTFNGVWPAEGYRRFTGVDGNPAGLGFKDSIMLYGNMKYNGIGYEGYGGWKWREFCVNDAIGISSSVWINCHHHLDEHDQESLWQSDGKKWILESITDTKLKFKRGPGNFSCSPNLGDHFSHLEGGIHFDDIQIESFEYEQTNPFFDHELNDISFKNYALKHDYPAFDYVYILLSWNGQYIAYNEDFSMHEPYITKIIDTIHKEFPNCKVRLLGIQSPSINGGITAGYGCYGLYSDVFGDLVTAYNYDLYLEELCNREEYKSFCRYIDTKAQFDIENNMPQMEVPVNTRCEKKEIIGTNGLHPTMNGYLQIGDVFYRALCADMEDEK